MENIRTKTVSWTDPTATAALGREHSGLEFLTRWKQGELANPPIGELIGFHLTAVTEGAVEFSCVPDESVYNPIVSALS